MGDNSKIKRTRVLFAGMKWLNKELLVRSRRHLKKFEIFVFRTLYPNKFHSRVNRTWLNRKKSIPC